MPSTSYLWPTVTWSFPNSQCRCCFVAPLPFSTLSKWSTRQWPDAWSSWCQVASAMVVVISNWDRLTLRATMGECSTSLRVSLSLSRPCKGPNICALDYGLASASTWPFFFLSVRVLALCQRLTLGSNWQLCHLSVKCQCHVMLAFVIVA